MMVAVLAPAIVFAFFSSSQSQSQGTDMSAVFAKLTSCDSCTSAGYGWCPIKRRCGGFANKECGLGPNYFAESAVPKRNKKAAPSPPRPSGNDMRSEFAKYRTCDSCVTAGYGWCPNMRRCGGFANKQCGFGERYVSAAPAERNGLWSPKAKRAVDEEAEAAPVADVPDASPSPAASLLYAGPVRAAVSGTGVTEAPLDEPEEEGAAATSAADFITQAHLANETALERSELMRLPVAALVDKILDLHSQNMELRK